MTVIAVVGAGYMGTALTFPASDNNHEVRLVGTHLDEEIIRNCLENGFHPKLKRPLPLNVTPFFHNQIAEAVPDAEIVVLGVNSRGVHWAAEQLAPYLRPGQITLMVTKGLEEDKTGALRVLPDIFAADLPPSIRDQIYYAAIGGPSIAGELAARRHTSVVFTSRTPKILPYLQAAFSTPYYHIWTSTDLIGVEVCVALKNPYALAVGLAAGLVERENPPDIAGAKQHNFAAAIFAQGLAETAQLVQVMGGGMETVFSLPGAGDLYVTTQGGRNSRMGRLLGMGMRYADAVEEMPNETVEGVEATIAIVPSVERMIANGQLPDNAMPLLRRLYKILTQNEPVDFDFNRFFGQLSFNPPV